jgi:hypothetical protein
MNDPESHIVNLLISRTSTLAQCACGWQSIRTPRGEAQSAWADHVASVARAAAKAIVDAPIVGEMIYGCIHKTGSVCGTVAGILPSRPWPDQCGRCYYVRENWRERHIRVRREADGQLWEVETSYP